LRKIRGNSQKFFTGKSGENIDSYSEEFLVTHSEEILITLSKEFLVANCQEKPQKMSINFVEVLGIFQKVPKVQFFRTNS